MPFERAKLSIEGIAAKAGIEMLASALRKHACPDEEEEKKLKMKMKSQNMSHLSPFSFLLKNGTTLHVTVTPMT